MNKIGCFASENLRAQPQSCWLTVSRFGCTEYFESVDLLVTTDFMIKRLDIIYKKRNSPKRMCFPNSFSIDKRRLKRKQSNDCKVHLPRSKITGRFRQESTGNRWNVEAVFPPENCRIFSDDFRPVPAGKYRKLTGIHRKKFNKFSVGILLPLPAISGAFLQDPVTFPLLSRRFLWDPVAVIFD
jgi:hypothetical protein